MTASVIEHPYGTAALNRTAMLKDIDLHLRHLTIEIADRSVGSAGNQAATDYVGDMFWNLGWTVSAQEFEVVDWEDGDASVTVDGQSRFKCSASPYAEGCDVKGSLVVASSLEEIRRASTQGALLLLTGKITQTPLMPKNFPFYSDDAQQAIIAALEASGALAILCATAHPPMIEDGDFGLPTVCLTEDVGHALAAHDGREARLVSKCRRLPSMAKNIIARINGTASSRIVITAHIDAKKDVPGALDNGTGVTMLLLLARALAAYDGPFAIELVALNGEDHYAVPGQLAYLSANPDIGATCALNINIDGIGYHEGQTAYSFFELPPDFQETAAALLTLQPNACPGMEWFQGDHAMFVQAGCPAIAVTSNWLLENIATQKITHSKADHMDLVDPERLFESALALKHFIEAIGQTRL
ncbi:M28 family peptidase [Gymnodinialimonas sp. 2305UL16-5]|uniref:M28 family peptidase n=1 Tax=Gymnodinialimonas mytili TaxID=3126503 RepID=UPI0030A85491